MAVLALSLFPGCKPPTLHSDTEAAKNPKPISAVTPSLTASDISILFPLKGSSAKDAVFKMNGTGICNLPGLEIGGKALVSQSLFSAFSREVFSGPGGVCPNSDTPLTSDTELMSANHHLAKLKGLPPELCSYKNWKIVGFRIDPCFERSSKGATLSAKNLTGCRAEARLIAQPITGSNAVPQIFDDTLHLIYTVPSLPALMADLRAVAKVRSQVEKSNPWESSGGGDPRMLRPHPGLRAEMNSCNGGMAKAISSFFARHTHTGLLRQMAWMTSSTAVTEWSFGVQNVKNGTFQKGGKTENYSSSLFSVSRGFPLNREEKLNLVHNANVAQLFVPDVLLAGKATAPKQKLIQLMGMLNDIQNPLKISQGQSGCVSCHMPDQLLKELGHVAGNPAGPRPYHGAKVWPPFAQTHRQFLNFRNFGYAVGFEPGVSQRAINETDDALKTLSTLP